VTRATVGEGVEERVLEKEKEAKYGNQSTI